MRPPGVFSGSILPVLGPLTSRVSFRIGLSVFAREQLEC